MPIYEYECKACNSVQEILQKIDDPAPAECPACAKGPLVKLLSRTGFILKGSGWYVTDFRGGGNNKPTGAAAGGSTGSSTPSESSASSSDTPSPTPASPAKDGGGGGCGAGGCGSGHNH
jgi:putative FmdB family regulatory protein